jgi:hypothetical protein
MGKKTKKEELIKAFKEERLRAIERFKVCIVSLQIEHAEYFKSGQ